MDIFWFERNAVNIKDLKQKSQELQKNGFSGTMYPYNIYGNDFFTQIPTIAEQDNNFKYIIAIRPYVISPQYLSMICNSLNKKYPNRIILNFLTGWIDEYEASFGGIVSYPNDNSDHIERSNYMIEYAKVFKNLNTTIPEFYISTTNGPIFEKCKQNSFAMIVPYTRYKEKIFDLKDTKSIISICPLFDKNYSGSMDDEHFTKETFFDFLDNCKENNISGILIHEDSNQEYETIRQVVKDYNNS